MAIQTTTTVSIKGQMIPQFERLFLSQAVAQHHFFELVVRLDVLETTGVALQNSQALIGEEIIISTSVLQGLGSFKENIFKGIVTEISNNLSHHGNKNRITIKGYSPTLVIDSSPNCASFISKSLSAVIQDTLTEYPENIIKKNISPLNDKALAYTVQYNETDFAFVNRLAHVQGEWFYYNGTELIFGWESGEPIALTYGYDLHEFNLSVGISNPKFTYIANDYLQAKEEIFDAASVNVGMNGLNETALKAAEKVFTKTPAAMNNRYFTERQTKSELETAAGLQKKAQVGKMVVLRGSSDNPGLQLGGTISIKDTLHSGPKPYGEYRITSITHQCNSMGQYGNNFEAVPIAVQVPPYTNVAIYPQSESQSAIVIDNKDPEGLQRLKVQFAWQKPSGETTPWVRMLTPHAGGGKGFYFTPEIGEEVMVDFEGGNAEKPFIVGTKYNTSAKSNYYNPMNDVKGFMTRSGTELLMNDKDGSVTINDPSGNTVIMKGNGETVIKAPLKLTLISTDIEILAGNSIKMISKPANEESGGVGEITILSKENTLLTSEEKKIDVVSKENITMVSQEQSINLVAQQKDIAILAPTGIIAVKAQQELNLQAAVLTNINGNSKVTIHGGKVEVNKG